MNFKLEEEKSFLNKSKREILKITIFFRAIEGYFIRREKNNRKGNKIFFQEVVTLKMNEENVIGIKFYSIHFFFPKVVQISMRTRLQLILLLISLIYSIRNDHETRKRKSKM